MNFGKFRTTADVCKYLGPSYLPLFGSKSSRGWDGVVVVEHLFHHVQTWVPLVRARDPETKLLVDVDRCLQEFMLMLMLMLAMMDILMVMVVEIKTR